MLMANMNTRSEHVKARSEHVNDNNKTIWSMTFVGDRSTVMHAIYISW